ncbi:hypothetical protein AJ78_04278 [Emergomyces pasteurianus Ep9510]|uniref:Uncharacterized protein n=1 Tax=Emergomyces pasteurianus Ep9510 TaxID=1447872 RepID=A0A1J9PHT8_9EURO|nr:hypothetical protein AJ78_04278 [Emergomyces pasteurianus Ep9510]
MNGEEQNLLPPGIKTSTAQVQYTIHTTLYGVVALTTVVIPINFTAHSPFAPKRQHSRCCSWTRQITAAQFTPNPAHVPGGWVDHGGPPALRDARVRQGVRLEEYGAPKAARELDKNVGWSGEIVAGGNASPPQRKPGGVDVLMMNNRVLRSMTPAGAQLGAAVRVLDTQMKRFRSQPSPQRIAIFLATRRRNPDPAGWSEKTVSRAEKAKKIDGSGGLKQQV